MIKSLFTIVILLLNFLFSPLSYSKTFKCCYQDPDQIEDRPDLSCSLPKFSTIGGDSFESTGSKEALKKCVGLNFPCVVKHAAVFSNKVTCQGIVELREKIEEFVDFYKGVPFAPVASQVRCPLEDVDVGPLPPPAQGLIVQQLKSLKTEEAQAAFISHLREELIKEGDKIESHEGYDVIIIGAGVAGTSSAMILAPKYKTLVIDAKKYPSSFGGKDFFLNINPSHGLEDEAGRVPIPSNLLLAPQLKGRDTASKMSDYLSLNLFQSGADVILGHPIVRAEASKIAEFPLAVVLDDKRVFYTKKVVEALGPGQAINPFKGLKGPVDPYKDPSVFTEDSFFTMIQDNPEEAHRALDGKDVVVLGRGDGGNNCVLAVRGITPSHLDRDHKEEHFTNSENPFTPKRFIQVGPQKLAFTNGAQHLSDEVAPESIVDRVDSIKKLAGGKYLLILENGEKIKVDTIVMALGRDQAASYWSPTDYASEKPNLVTQIEYHPGNFITLMMDKAAEATKEIQIEQSIPPVDFQRFKNNRLKQRALSIQSF